MTMVVILYISEKIGRWRDWFGGEFILEYDKLIEYILRLCEKFPFLCSHLAKSSDG